jgi:PIN domain nuclease of toxin-antitoxin system
MNILLDTCTFLWAAMEPNNLSAQAARLFTDPANAVYLSAISAYEIVIKHALGRLPLPDPPRQFVPDQRAALRVDSLDLREEAALHVERLPSLHRDPFDRLLICQAIVHDMLILTPDVAIRSYPAVRTDW